MTHYAVGVITEEKPTMEMIEELLAPFDEELSVESYVSHPYDEIKPVLLSYFLANPENPASSKLIHALENDDFAMLRELNEELNYYEGIDENGNAISTYNPNSKWDWYEIGGRWRDIHRKNPMKLSEFPKSEHCYAILTPDGVWHEPGQMGWWGISLAEKDTLHAWPDVFWEIINSFPKTYYITVVDCHI